jgi:acyl carrier protein
MARPQECNPMNATARARALLSDALGIPETGLPQSVRIGEIDQWDSLAHARLLLALEEAAGRMLDAADTATIESLDDIASLLHKLEGAART